jgi:hypothetical protein
LSSRARQQFALGAEVIVDRGEIDVRRGDDVAHRDAVVAALGEQLFGGEENLLARIRVCDGCGFGHAALTDFARVCFDTKFLPRFSPTRRGLARRAAQVKRSFECAAVRLPGFGVQCLTHPSLSTVVSRGPAAGH